MRCLWTVDESQEPEVHSVYERRSLPLTVVNESNGLISAIEVQCRRRPSREHRPNGFGTPYTGPAG